MQNIKFNYLYRDASNYKNYGFIVFENPEGMSQMVINNLINIKLIDGEFFYAQEWQLPDLHFKTWNDQTDHTFHEFESIEYTDEPANTLLNLGEFVTLIKKHKLYITQ